MNCFFRGTTIEFATTFYDATGAVTQPSGAEINIVAISANQIVTTVVEMIPPSGGQTQWTAQWDSRNTSPGRVSWSIHTEGGAIPYGVEDGSFELTANNANLPTF